MKSEKKVNVDDALMNLWDFYELKLYKCTCDSFLHSCSHFSTLLHISPTFFFTTDLTELA